MRWYRRAAEQGHASGQTTLGVMYAEGQGVPPDIVLAHTWFRLAAAQGNEKAMQARDFSAKRMTAVDVSKAERLAREWLEKHPK